MDAAGSNNGENGSQQQQQPVLQFHNTRGEYVRISNDRSTARRFESFCKGIAFSQRPVRPNEKVYLRVVETSAAWNGVLRIGFTSCNPASYGGVLPKYACPGKLFPDDDDHRRRGIVAKDLQRTGIELFLFFRFN